jgi:protein SCO1/2
LKSRILSNSRAPLLAIIIALLCAGTAVAQSAPAPLDVPVPEEMKGVGIEEKLNAQLPLDLQFTDESGAKITLANYFNNGRPVILTLNYYRCPMLCTLTLNGLVDGLNDIEWTAGKEFDIVTVSINPNEGPDLADVKKRAYLTQYQRDSVKNGWHFLTGTQENITALAEAVGFKYNFVERTGEYAHSSSIVFVTPAGRISLYMNDVVFEPRDLRLALVDASRGTIGAPLEKFLLFTCFMYDAEAGSFVPSAWKIMRTGGLVTVVAMMMAGFVLWKRTPKVRAVDVVAPLASEGVS